MKYRAEIDGLRALAVIPVIFYHAGFSLFSGGYVGVDVFFVISGFLITTIIHDEIQQGCFSLARFYERRARRILPALIFICLVSLPFAWLWMLPDAFKAFGHSLTAVSLFVSNILFAGESDYFAAAAELKPLLHTWSLGIEEQFYLFFPLLLLLLRKLKLSSLFIVLAAISIASLGLADWASGPYPVENFYWLLSRAWELGAGAMLAITLPLMRNTPIWRAQSLSVIGLAMIVYAILFFDSALPFPGRWAVIPVTGTLLIIAYATPRTVTGKLLSFKPIVAIGLISYSAYLWHQPLFAFARIIKVDSPQLLFTLSLCAMLLAWFSWRFVEAPFRNKNNFSRQQIFSLGLAASLILISIGTVISLNNGFDYRYNAKQKQILAYLSYDATKAYREGSCFLRSEQTASDFAPECFADNREDKHILLWGDSHAAAFSYGLRKHHPNLSQITASACSPLPGYAQKRRPNCAAINDYALQFIARQQPGTIILHANWRDSYGKASQSLETLLSNTVLRIRAAAPNAKIILLGDTPQWQPSLPAELISAGVHPSAETYLPSESFDKLHNIDQRLKAIAAKSGASHISLLDILCRQDRCLSGVPGEDHQIPLVWDYGHLTREASIKLAGITLEIMESNAYSPQH